MASYFGINKNKKLISQKYNWPSFCKSIKAYVKGYNIYLDLKTVRHKPHNDLQLLFVSIHWWKDPSIDFVTGFLILTNWKVGSYDFILVIIDWLKKMLYYKLVKVIIDTKALAEVIFDMVMQHHCLSDSIVNKQGSVFTHKFWLSLSYFFGIKWRLLTAFFPQTGKLSDKIAQ